MLKEIESRKDEISAPAEVKTLYIGGGTPSVLPLSVLGSIVSAIKALCPDGFMEFTVEVNPDDVTPSYASGLRDLGVDRVSMGVQSFDDGILRWMNRRHDSTGAVKAFHTLREAGFRNISIDLIFGLPQLSDVLWADTVSKALALAPEHVSAYQLSVEGGSALSEMLEKGNGKRLRKTFAGGSTDSCARNSQKKDTAIMKSPISPSPDVKPYTIPHIGGGSRT